MVTRIRECILRRAPRYLGALASAHARAWRPAAYPWPAAMAGCAASACASCIHCAAMAQPLQRHGLRIQARPSPLSARCAGAPVPAPTAPLPADHGYRHSMRARHRPSAAQRSASVRRAQWAVRSRLSAACRAQAAARTDLSLPIPRAATQRQCHSRLSTARTPSARATAAAPRQAQRRVTHLTGLSPRARGWRGVSTVLASACVCARRARGGDAPLNHTP